MITALGSLGTATNKVATTSLQWSLSRTVPVGRFVVIFASTDNVHDVGQPDGVTQERWNVVDNVGNVWVTLGGVTDTSCFSKCGSASHIFVTQVRREITPATILTLSCQAESFVTARAVSVEEFDLGAGMTWATQEAGPSRQQSAGEVDPAPISLSGLPILQEYLWLHVLGSEGPSTDTFTWDADYTRITGAGTTGGTYDTNINVQGGYRIATATSDTVDIASTLDRDHTQVLVAVSAVPIDTRFPESPILDDFNRADEEPLDNGGNWDTIESAGPSSPGSPRFMRVEGNQATGGAATGGGGQTWEEEFFGCAEVRVDIPVRGGAGVVLHLHASGDTASANFNAGATARWDNAVPSHWNRGNIYMGSGGNAGDVDQLKLRAWVELADGYKLGMKRHAAPGTTHALDRLFVDIGDGWEQIGAIQREEGIVFVTDGPIFSGEAGLAAWNQTVRLDNFGAMDVECFVFGRPQIIRYR